LTADFSFNLLYVFNGENGTFKSQKFAGTFAFKKSFLRQTLVG
jgi:hypothetical protein